jgi:cytochrome P450
MTTQQSDERQVYDPLADTPAQDLYDKYQILRDQYPVYHNPVRDAWCISRYDDVFNADRDWQTFTTGNGVELGLPAHFLGAGDFLETDPPLHDYLRNMVQGKFTPVAVRALARRVDQRVVDLLDRVDGEADLAHDFAWQIPIWMMCTILGIPNSDQELVDRWLTEMSDWTPGADALPDAGVAARDSLHDYLASLAKERSRHPADDLITTLSQAADSKELEMQEILGIALLLFVAGSETTASLISSALLLLDAHPELQADLRSGGLDLTSVIEEVLRYEAPVQYLCRTTTREVTVRDITLPQGARVVLLYGSANRDERRYASADSFDPYRSRRQHLAFGHGIHACLGAPLARLEGEIALRRFLEEVPVYEITGPPVRMNLSEIRRIAKLPAIVTHR